MAGNNRTGNPTLTKFTSETARAAALKSQAKQKEKREQARAEAAIEKARTERDLSDWTDLYQRDQLSAVTAAAAQKIAHMILDGEIKDDRALIQALPALVDITRLEEGLHTSATMHASVSMSGDPMEKIREIRAQAQRNVLEVGAHSTPPDQE